MATRSKSPKNLLLEAAINFQTGLLATQACKDKEDWDKEKYQEAWEAQFERIRPSLAGRARYDTGLAEQLVTQYKKYKAREGRARLTRERD